MFSIHCPRHDSEVLLGNNRIRSIDRTGPTLTVRWECYCGHQGAHHRPVATPGGPVVEAAEAAEAAEDVAEVSPHAVAV